ncbi:hypothetical protein C2S52_021805 [Perilla frutescens var. hirtella]|nr:hypothetical protein C2S52_021805 [Perilla frutescens var. hirtella]
MEAAETKIQERMEDMNADMQGKFDYLTKLLAEMRLELLKRNKGKKLATADSILGEPPPSAMLEFVSYLGQSTTRHMAITNSPNSQVLKPLPKIDFPKFDGPLPRSWIIKCNGYFSMIPNLSDSQKITLATMQFEEKAAQWYQNLAARLRVGPDMATVPKGGLC